MKRLLPTLALTLLTLTSTIAPAWAALPGESPADTYQVEGPRVRSVVVVGDNVWIGGRFSEVRAGNGSKVADVSNLAVLSRSTGGLSLTASPLRLAGVANAEVWDLAVSGSTVYAAGKFTMSSGGKTYKNLLAFDGATGSLITAFRPINPQASKAVTVQGGSVFAGGSKLYAVDAGTGAVAPGFATSTIATDLSLRPHNTPPQHRDLEVVGGFLYSACQCDSLTQSGRARPVKALVRFDPVTGLHDESFALEGLGIGSVGLSLAANGDDLYLGAGGSDFVARYSATQTYGDGTVGAELWRRDTSGSVQAIEVNGGDLLVGGHFVEIGDQSGDRCGHRSSDPGTLDPFGECETRNRLAAYTLTGTLQAWNPSVTGKYNGVWSIALDGAAVHIGGEFTKVHGVAQTYYARFD